MNKCYQVVWNSTLRILQVCSELVIGKRSASSVTRTVSVSTHSQGKYISFPSRVSLLFLPVLLALSGIASADLTVDSSLGNNPLSVTQINGIANAGNVIVGNSSGGSGVLNVSDGGSVAAASVKVGDTAGSTGVINIDGTGSSFTTGNGLVVGNAGTGTITLTNGAVLSSNSMSSLIGSRAGGNGTVTVSSGSTWNNTVPLVVGQLGTGALNILTGGTVTGSGMTIGGQTTGGGKGVVNVTGLGSVLDFLGITVGGGHDTGTGTLTIADSGVVNTTRGWNDYVSNGTVTIDGVGSRWDSTSLIVGLGGVGGPGTLILTNGAVMTDTTATVGNTTSDVAEVSSDSVWSTSGALTVGNLDTGIININTSGTVNAGTTTLGSLNTGSGTVNVNGVRAVMNTTALVTGASGQGRLTITDGGVVNTAGAGVGTGITGSAAGSTGTVTVDGAGSRWNLTGRLVTGAAGTGTMTLTNAASVTSWGGIVGDTGKGLGTVDVSTGAMWDSTVLSSGIRAALTVGNAATGTLNIHDGGKVDSASIILGNAVTGDGSVTVDGPGSVLNADNLMVGQSGTGSLAITNGGVVDSRVITSTAGVGAGSTGTVVVDGAGSQWLTKTLFVGDSGSSTMTLTDGALLQTDGGGTIGKSAGGIGTVNVSSGAVWNSAMNVIEVGSAGTGSLNINAGGTVNTDSFAVGTVAGGKGAVVVDGTDAVLNTGVASAPIWAVGYMGTGEVQIRNGGLMTSKGGTIGQFAGSDGIVTVSRGGQWTVDASSSGSSLITVGDTGTGMLTLSNGGMLAITGSMPGVVSISQKAGSSGTLNIGAAHGEAATGAGFITGADSVNMGAGSGTLVFNHTETDPTTAGGYQFTPLITGNGTVIQDAGHTVLRAENTFSGATQVNGGTLTTTLQSNTGNTGLGSSTVNIATPGTLEVAGATTDGTGNFTFSNVLTGSGLLSVDLASADDIFSFDSSTGTAFTGTVELKDSTFALSGGSAAALARAMLMTSTGNTTTVGDGEQTTGGLTFAGGKMVFNATAPEQKVATSHLTTGKLDASGTGTVQINVPAPYVPGHDTATTASLMTQDDTNIGLELVSASQVTGSGGSFVLKDQNGNTISDATEVDIAQDGNTVAKGTYDYRLTTAGASGNQDGLYVNYGLTELDILQGQTLTLDGTPGATGAAADQSARITGSGNLAISTTGGDVLSLSDGGNDYTGSTTVLSGTLRTDADGALGNTSELHIYSTAKADLNGTEQTVGQLAADAGSVLDINGGSLSLTDGGYSNGSLTGAGSLNVDGGTLTIDGANSGLSATTAISSGAEAVINDAQGAGTGNIADNGTLTLDGVTGTLANNISGSGSVDATNTTETTLTGDNGGFSGLFTIDDGSSLTVSEQNNLGTATVNDNGLLTVDTASDWTLSNSVSGSGGLTKSGTGTLTLTVESAAYTGTTDISAGTLALGSDADNAVDMAGSLVNVHDGASFTGYGSTAGDVDVMQGGTMQMNDFTVGGNLTNSGAVLLNHDGGQPGNQLTVNGNYTGNDGLMVFNTTLGGDDSPTDKLTVHGDTSGNTRVDVNNVGGSGAQTINGIELVQVDGNSAGNFGLTNGTVEAGAYVYTLAKGPDDAAKNWYLTSKWNGAVPPQDQDNPPVVDPTAPDALRPEAGSYISNIAAANTLFGHRLHDRPDTSLYADTQHNGEGNTSLWIRHVGGHERSSAGDGQLKTQSNRYVLQLGGDIARWSSNGLDRWHLGVMGGYANEHSNTRSSKAGYGSDGRISGYSAGLYGTWYQNEADKAGAYVDSWMLYNWFDNTVEADNRGSDSYDSKGLTASLEVGYTLKAGEFSGSQGTLNSWYVQPQAQVMWMGVKADSHTRNDGTRVGSEGDGNIQTRLGVRTYLSSHHKMDDGKQREFQPFVEVNWLHNTETFGVKMDGTTVNRDGARNLGEVRTGVEGRLNDRLSVWGNVGVQMGDKGYSDTQGMLGVKYSW
ncbi:autotransporter family porin [Yokenella regensburgei]|uniref:Autotransporter family porin n=1 Tax=Yokenella regensburgei TaxID=158877 RepID=A0ABX9S852_9ENTR|nr:autotransporter family porin [Yokenella regensburgei]VFS16016.1 Outer membrane protein IcsA autotransporter precursor [Yokenella regensburgei]